MGYSSGSGSSVRIKSVTAICNEIHFVTIILLRSVVQLSLAMIWIVIRFVTIIQGRKSNVHTPGFIFVGNRIKPGKSYK
jgi:hypothetical protein